MGRLNVSALRYNPPRVKAPLFEKVYMAETSGLPGLEGQLPHGKRLDSWGEIAAYFRREIRTVQRWEKYEGLPVKRHKHQNKSTVYAYENELAEWFRRRQPEDDPEADAKFEPEPDSPEPSSFEPECISAGVKTEPTGQTQEASGLPGARELDKSQARKEDRIRGSRWRWIAVAAAAVVLAASGYGIYRWLNPVNAPESKVRLVVLPFTNLSGDPKQDYVSAGLTDELITQLGRLDPQHLGVIAPTSSQILASRSIPEIGRTLNVQYAMEGSVRGVGNEIRIDVRLIQVSDQTHVWADSFNEELSDLLHGESQVASAVAHQILKSLPVSPRAAGVTAEASTGTNATDTSKAVDAYLRGRFAWGNRRDPKTGIEFFEQAIHLDPSYAKAYAGLASATAIIGQTPNDGMLPLEAKPKAREFAERALRLDPTLAEAHAVLGNVAMSYDWDLGTAEREFKTAIELNPNDPTAYEWYCHLLIVEGRNEEALANIEHALDLDPVSPIFHTVLAEAAYYRRDYDAAIDEAQSVISSRPDFVLAQFWLGSAYREKKMYAQAVATFAHAREISGDNPAMVMAYGHAQALAGNTAEARKALHLLEQMQQTRFIPDIYLAAIHVGLGDKDEAFRLLNSAYKQRIDRLVYLKVEPMAEPLRSDPRFAQLLHKIGLQ